MGVIEAAAIVTSLKDASELVGKALASNAKDAGPITDLLINARLAVLGLIEQQAVLRDQVSNLTGRITELENENRRLSDFDSNSGKFERVQWPTGVFVYQERQAEGSNSPSPFFCPHCFAEQKIRILQQNADGTYFRCHACNFGDYKDRQREEAVSFRGGEYY